MLIGFHGKMPGAGDFVSRGLPMGFAAFWDAWATRNLAPRQGAWPAGGVRLRLVSGGRVAAGVVVASEDRVGRRFPLAAFAIARDLPADLGLEPWCNAAAAALQEAIAAQIAPDQLLDVLEAIAEPVGEGGGSDPMVLWLQGARAQVTDPANPQEVLDRLFSCSGSSPL